MLDFVESSASITSAHSKYHRQVSELLAHADVQTTLSSDDNPRAWDMHVHNPKLFGRVLGQGSLGLGEAYMDGWWDCEQLDEFFHRVISANLAAQVRTWQQRWSLLQSHLCNLQIRGRLKSTAAEPYNIGNDLYRCMLDPAMIYTCAYWQDADNLEQAQQHKLELVARKLQLEPGMRVLDIGCGWGGAAEYLAKHHNVDVVGITLSEEQYRVAKEQYAGANIHFELRDFREVNQRFDRIYSLGMFEHVGFKNYARYFETVDSCLTPGGLFLLHTIGHRTTSHHVDPWMNRYVFPNSILPSAELITRHAAPQLTLQDWHNFGMDYHRTLLAWDANCQASWSELPSYDERFRRMWHYFLMCSAGAFKAGHNHLWQIVFSKGTLTEPYVGVRSAV